MRTARAAPIDLDGNRTTIAARIGSYFEGDDWEGYVRCHAPRFANLLKIAATAARTFDEDARILDVGRTPFTDLLAHQIGRPVDSLGILEPEGPTSTGDNYQVDLNDVFWPERLRDDLPRYPLILFAEVIEHLKAPPSLVLPFLRDRLVPGGRIVIQTPNAVALHKRLKMLAGSNPYNLLVEDWTRSGHVREYTREELLDYTAASGLEVEYCGLFDYFDYRYRHHPIGEPPRPVHRNHLLNVAYQWCPPALRPGITLIGRRPG